MENVINIKSVVDNECKFYAYYLILFTYYFGIRRNKLKSITRSSE